MAADDHIMVMVEFHRFCDDYFRFHGAFSNMGTATSAISGFGIGSIRMECGQKLEIGLFDDSGLFFCNHYFCLRDTDDGLIISGKVIWDHRK